jgi:hypothetical protein
MENISCIEGLCKSLSVCIEYIGLTIVLLFTKKIWVRIAEGDRVAVLQNMLVVFTDVSFIYLSNNMSHRDMASMWHSRVFHSMTGP